MSDPSSQKTVYHNKDHSVNAIWETNRCVS